MDAWLTNTEVQIAVDEKIRGQRRERAVWNPSRPKRLRDLAMMLLSLIF